LEVLTSAELVWLLAAVAKGDREAFDRLYAATCAKLYGAVLRILRRPELADEVLRDAYVEIWSGAVRFDPAEATPITWMVAIARNRAIELLRKNPELSVEEVPEAKADAADPLAAHEFSDELKRLLACLGRLDGERRKLVLMAYYDGYSREQLSVQFDKPVNTIKTSLRRSLLDLRECMGA